MRADLRFLETLENQHASVRQSLVQQSWVLCETNYRAAEISQAISQNPIFQRVVVSTIGDAIRTLITALSSLPSRSGELDQRRMHRLRDEESKQVIYQIVHRNPSRYALLFQELSLGNGIFSSQLESLKRFLDLARLDEAHEKFFKSVIDEFGNARQEKQRLEELIYLLDQYDETCVDANVQDGVSQLVWLVQKLSRLSSADWTQAGLPEKVILEQPTHFFPLESSHWREVARLTHLTLHVDQSIVDLRELLMREGGTKGIWGSDLPITQRHAWSLAAFLAQMGAVVTYTLPAASAERLSLVQWLLESEPVGGVSHTSHNRFLGQEIVVWDSEDRREEVQRLVGAIAQAINAGSTRPEDYHIVTFGLEPYHDLLTREFLGAGIPFVMPKGFPVCHSSAGMACKLFLEWLMHPSAQSLSRCFSHQGIKLGTNLGEDNATLFRSFSTFLETLPVPPELVRETLNRIPIGLEFDAPLFCRWCVHWGLPMSFENRSTWAEPLLAQIFHTLLWIDAEDRSNEREKCYQLLAMLSVLHRELIFMDSLYAMENDLPKFLRAVRKRFFLTRVRIRDLGELEQAGSVSDEALRLRKQLLADYVQASRKIREVFRSLIKESKAYEGSLQFVQEKVGRCFSCLKLIAKSIDAAYVDRGLNYHGVVVTELLDSRALWGKCVAILGMTNEEFPLRYDQGGTLGSETDEIVNRLREKRGGTSRIDEGFWLLSHILRSSREILISVPRRTELSDGLRSQLLADLHAVVQCEETKAFPAPISVELGEYRLDGSKAESKATGRATSRSHMLLQKRYRNAFSEYDGLLESSTWQALQQAGALAVFSKKGRRYSISELEALGECPHAFFFEKILGLRVASPPLIQELSKHIGTLVHQALTQFFRRFTTSIYQCDDSSFAEACQFMLEVSTNLFSESVFNWDNHQLLRSAKERIVAGLETGEDNQRRGYLKAALVFERMLLPSSSKEMEYSFGNNRNDPPPLRLEISSGEVLIRGIIDRLDFSGAPGKGNANGNSDGRLEALWDYKTGRAASLRDVERGKSLQVPLYVAAWHQNSTSKQMPRRGGCIVLAEPNRRDDDIANPRSGVLVEHLALSGRGSVCQEELVPQTVERALSQVKVLDRLVVEGQFHQILETTKCPYCDYQAICGRNTSLLEEKLAGGEESRRLQIVGNIPIPAKNVWFSVETCQTKSEENTKEAQKLSSEQDAACVVEKDLVVVAGAGSGKTFVLQQRILRLIEQGADVSTIVAITFTEKAALEIRTRVQNALREILRTNIFEGQTLEASQRVCFREATARLSLAHIGTIHGFARKLIGMCPELSGGIDQGQVISSGEREEIVNQLIDEICITKTEAREHKLTNSRASVLSELLMQGISFSYLRGNLKKLVYRPVLRYELARSFGKDMEQHLLALQQKYLEKEKTRVVDYLAWWFSAFEKWYRADDRPNHYAELHDKAARLQDALLRQDGQSWIDLTADILNFLIENQRLAIRKNAKTNPINFWLELRDFLGLMELSVLKTDLKSETAGLELSQKTLLLVEQISSRYQEEKRKRLILDFDDLILCAHQMICLPQEGAKEQIQQRHIKRLKDRFRHLLIDEFQDTDQYQWDILRVLSKKDDESADGNRGNSEGKNLQSLFIVGDAKQAIYSFRGGDSRAFARARNEILARGGEELSLVDNYRSASEVITFGNELFSRLLAVDYSASGDARVRTAVKPQPLKGKRSGQHGRVSLLHHRYMEGEGSDVNGDVGEASTVALFLKEVCAKSEKGFAGDGQWWEPERGTEGGAKVAVLTRTVKQLTHMAQALAAHDVPFSIFHSGGFYDLEEIVQLENLMRALVDPADEIALVGALRSPLFGFSDSELVHLYLGLEQRWSSVWNENQDQKSDQSKNEQLVNLKEAKSLLLSWKRYAAYLTPSSLLEMVVEDTNLWEIYERAGHGEAYRNILRFIDQIREEELARTIPRGLIEVVRWIGEQRGTSSRAPIANLSTHPVVLMTIHGAKGLEFPMVVLPFLQTRSFSEHDFLVGAVNVGARDGQGDDNYRQLLAVKVEDEKLDYKRAKTLVHKVVEEATKAEKNSEERRVFYVACTRARDSLVLVLREGNHFLKKQQEIQATTREEQNEAIFFSDQPSVWLRNLLRLNDLENPTAWELEVSNGKIVNLPIIYRPDQ